MDQTRRDSSSFWNRDANSSAALDKSDSFRSPWRWLGLLALASSIIGRGLSVAVPGSGTGIRNWIAATRITGAFLSQLALVTCAATAISLIGATIWRSQFKAFHRFLIPPVGAAVVTIAALSTQHRLGVIETTLIGFGAIALATVAGIVTLIAPATRAIGLVMVGTAFSSLLYLVARILGHDPQAGGLLGQLAARHFATWAFAADALSLSIAAAWLASRRVRQMVPALGIGVVVAAVISWAATAGTMDGASLWQVLASRTLSEMTRYPNPFIELPARYWLEAYAVLLAMVVAVAPRRTALLEASLTLVILSRASVDVPLCALFLSVGALLAPFELTSE